MRSLFLSCVMALTAILPAAAPVFLLNSSAMAAPAGSRFNAEYFTNLPLVTHEGKTVRFYDDLIKDKLVVINFSYLTCNDICPLSTARLAEVKRRLGEAVGRDVFIYTITMDPVNDTPEMLKVHAGAFEAGNGWLFLTGKPEDVERIRFQLGERSRKLTEHRNDLVMGNEKTGDWSRSSLFADIEVIVAGVRELDPVWRTAERKRRRSASRKPITPRPKTCGSATRRARRCS
jgi:protein SCO1